MGLKPVEVRMLTLKEFDLMLTGYNRRQEREWDRTRHLLSFIQTFAGIGASQYTSPQELFPLSLDNENKKRMITTMAQAKTLYKEFVN